jgi:hypothetical protein
MSLKNRDYAGKEGTEPFANFTRVEAMGICTTEQGFMCRLTDKMSRLSSFVHENIAVHQSSHESLSYDSDVAKAKYLQER